MSKRELSFQIRAVDRATAVMRRIEQRIQNVSKPIEKLNRVFKTSEYRARKYTKALSEMSERMERIGTSATIGLTLPIAAIGATSIKTAAVFEHAMKKVKALTRGEMFRQLKDQAREFGASTMHSATEAANAMVFYSMAGFKSLEILKSMPSTLHLATAATEELAATADIVTSVIRGYEIPLDRVTQTVDMMTAGFANAKMDLLTLGEALTKAGPTFNKLNIPISETLALIGALRDAGIDASSVGTALASGVSRLVDPVAEVKSKFKELLGIDATRLTDKNGQLGSLLSILEQLNEAGASPADYYAIFGLEPGKYLMQLLGATEKVRNLQREIENSTGITKKFSEEFASGATGAMYAFKSAVEAAQISIGESGLLDFFTDITFAFADYIRTLSKVNPALIRIGTVVTAIVGIIGPSFLAISYVLASLASKLVFLKFAATMAKVFGVSILALFGKFILIGSAVIGAIAGISYAIWFLYRNWRQALVLLGDLTLDFIKVLTWPLKKHAQFLTWVAGIFTKLLINPKAAIFSFATDVSDRISSFVDSVRENLKKLANFILDWDLDKSSTFRFQVVEDMADYPSFENPDYQVPELRERLSYDMGPLNKAPEMPLQYQGFTPNNGSENSKWDQPFDLAPNWVEGSFDTIVQAFSNPIVDLEEKIEIDIDERKLGEAIKLNPKIPKPNLGIEPKIFEPWKKDERFKQSVHQFRDRSTEGKFHWNRLERWEAIESPSSATEVISKTDTITNNKLQEYAGAMKRNEIERTTLIEKESVSANVVSIFEKLSEKSKVLESSSVIDRLESHKLEESRYTHEIRESRDVDTRQKEVIITVNFENLPQGIEIDQDNPDNVPLSVNMGFAMDGYR